jgi:hypothetical protein
MSVMFSQPRRKWRAQWRRHVAAPLAGAQPLDHRAPSFATASLPRGPYDSTRAFQDRVFTEYLALLHRGSWEAAPSSVPSSPGAFTPPRRAIPAAFQKVPSPKSVRCRQAEEANACPNAATSLKDIDEWFGKHGTPRTQSGAPELRPSPTASGAGEADAHLKRATLCYSTSV